MKSFFIEEVKKGKKVISVFKKVDCIDNKIIINRELKKMNLKNKIIIVKRIKKIIDRESVRQVAIEKKLKEDEQFIKLLYSNNINICNPKWIFKKCTDKVINKALINKKREESEIWICVNEVDNITQEYIYKFAKEFKSINIVTNHIGKFKKIEEKLYNEEGILITITNNRRKSLLKAELIINADFPKEIINEFAIYDKSTIINWDEPLKIRKKRFTGKIIEEVKLELDKDGELAKFIEEEGLQNYDERDICQAIEFVPDEKIYIN